MNVVVLSCGRLGAEVATALIEVPGVERVTLATAPYRAKRTPQTLPARLRAVHRAAGLPGVAAAVAGRLLAPFRRPNGAAAPVPWPALPAGVEHLRFADFHDPDALAALRALAPDLGVVAGTYILRESVFGIPAQGMINLHSGKVPEYRGAAPAFWELYNGEESVGITIHRVTAALDAGHILAQEQFPLDPAPPGDPLTYLDHYRRAVLRPNGVRLLAQVVGQLATGTARERPQPLEGARTYRSPDYRAVRELRRRVRRRRAARRTGHRLIRETTT
ncbi:MAG TPA: formyltransferase family protein [Gemmatimonadales bacterium]|nr:formyltransferase family protein [Gemmatimonadales bacterium]